MKDVYLTVLASPGCHTCKEFEDFWKTVEKDWQNVHHDHVEVTTPKGQELVQKFMIFASPGIILNGELFATGGYNKDQFLAKIKELSA